MCITWKKKLQLETSSARKTKRNRRNNTGMYIEEISMKFDTANCEVNNCNVVYIIRCS